MKTLGETVLFIENMYANLEEAKIIGLRRDLQASARAEIEIAKKKSIESKFAQLIHPDFFNGGSNVAS